MWKTNRLTGLIGAAILGCVVLWTASGMAQQAPPIARDGFSVAVVDISKVMQNSIKWQDATQKRLDLMERMKRTLSKQGQQVQVLRNAYESLPPGTEQKLQKQAELRDAMTELQKARRDFEERLARQHEEALRSFFRKLREAVSEYAEESELDLVLKAQSMNLSGPGSPGQNLQLATTEVLYARPELDISNAVMERLNADFAEPIEVK